MSKQPFQSSQDAQAAHKIFPSSSSAAEGISYEENYLTCLHLPNSMYK